jgi:hypothetical protein
MPGFKVGKARVKHTKCPFCGYLADRVSIVEDKPQVPDDGDVGICIHCGEWMVYENRLEYGVRKPDDEEYEWLATDPVTTALRAAWVGMDAKRKAKDQ